MVLYSNQRWKGEEDDPQFQSFLCNGAEFPNCQIFHVGSNDNETRLFFVSQFSTNSSVMHSSGILPRQPKCRASNPIQP